MTVVTPASGVNATTQRFPMRGLAVLAGCVVLGPLMGGLALVLAYLAAIVYSYALYGPSTLPPDVVETVAGLAGMVLMFSYIFGGAQALMSGLWLGFRAWKEGNVSAREAVLTGVAVSMIFYLCLTLWEMQGGLADVRANAGMGLFLGILSVVAALAVRWVLIKLGALPRATTSKAAST
jgi:hypothetical protein